MKCPKCYMENPVTAELCSCGYIFRKRDLPSIREVTLTNIDIPFGRMIAIILKFLLAAIPAVLLMYLILFGIALIFGVGLGGCAAFLSQ